MLNNKTDDGDYLVPDQRCCYFHKHIGEQKVREVADREIALISSAKPEPQDS